MKTNVIPQLWKAVFASLSITATLLTTLAGAAEVLPNQTAESLQTSAQTPATNWKNVPTQTINANDVSFVYREMGQHNGGTPVVFLVHLAAVLDNWDPRIMDGLATKHHVIAFDNGGIGASTGSPSNSIEQMADDAIAFIQAKGLDQVDLLGFSMGGMIAQEMVLKQPQLRVADCALWKLRIRRLA